MYCLLQRNCKHCANCQEFFSLLHGIDSCWFDAERGAEVTIFLDLEGVRLAEKRQTLDFQWAQDALAEHYKKISDNGGKVNVCPHCAKSAHIGADGLWQGLPACVL